jgi:cytochrome c oxidase subunit 2
MRRIVVIWVVLSVVGLLAVWFGLQPHMPPGTATAQAHEQREANTIIAMILTPITLAVLIFFVYALTNFRQRGELLEDGPPLHGDARIQGFWVAGTVTVVLCLAAYGTYALYATESNAAGSGGGQGATLISAAPSDALVVQVVSQQWQFTYRYPQYGGVETTELALPVGRTVVFHVTSLDVIHSFWAYQLGVKADANPGVDNIVFVKPTEQQAFNIRCSELCGIWHGYMFDTGRVVSPSAFQTWIANQRKVFAPVAHYLPPYSTTYIPEPTLRGG